MLGSPPMRESKTICRPSGDQRGVPVSTSPKFVSCRVLLPSLSHTHISLVPERLDMNTTLLPSGEITGLDCSRVEGARIREVSFVPSRSTLQIFVLTRTCT